jgi:hypothetical protein
LVGAVLFGRGFRRALLPGLWAGYLLFGLTYTYHLPTTVLDISKYYAVFHQTFPVRASPASSTRRSILPGHSA